MILPHYAGGVSLRPRRGASQRGHSLSQKRMAPLQPQEKCFLLAVSGLNALFASGMKLPARGKAALALQDDLADSYYPLPLC